MRTRAIRRLPRVILGLSCCVLVSGACRSSGPGVRNDRRERVLSLFDADSLVFAAVVRGQLAGSDDVYPYRLTRFRFDSSPYRAAVGYPDMLGGIEGTASAMSFPRASESESEINYVIDTRKRILRTNGVQEGKLVAYPQCAGAGVPTPPPPARARGSSARRVPARSVHAGCPKVAEHFLTVGLPIHGRPPGLTDRRDTRGNPVRLDGEVWTVLVDETAVGPAGWRQSRYAWLFERNRLGALALAHTILIGVSE